MSIGSGATLGVVGGGQLGLYFVLAARRCGYVTRVLDPDPQAPAAQVAHEHLVARFDDTAALDRLADGCAAITLEFENVPAQSLARLAERCRVVPSPGAVRIAQDRLLEKTAAAAAGLSPVPHAALERDDSPEAAIAVTGLPAILKTVRMGYDGLGQRVCRTRDELAAARKSLGDVPLVLERRIDLAAEVSVVLARSDSGVIRCFPPSRNHHRNGILSRSVVPSGLGSSLESSAIAQATALADSLDYRGVLAVEFFVDPDDRLWFNEMAPRPHNSGHYTLDATDVSQFEQQLRALCDVALATPRRHSAVSMFNLLGERWTHGTPAFDRMMGCHGARLHLYGKAEPRSGRKMGHVNCLACSAEEAIALADRAEGLLVPT